MTIDDLKMLRDAYRRWSESEPRLEGIRSVEKNKIVLQENSMEWVYHGFGYYQALEEILAVLEQPNKHPETFIPAPEHQVNNRPGIHQNDDGSKTFDYVTTDGMPCKIRMQPGYEGKIVDGILQVTRLSNSAHNLHQEACEEMLPDALRTKTP